MTDILTERSWLKLSDGESMQFVILDDVPQIHTLHWVGGAAQEHLDADCPWCKQGLRASVRRTIPIESQDGSDAWEMADLTWKDLMAVGKATGGIKGQTIALSRRGTGRATRYTIVPLGKRAPSSSPAPAAAPTAASTTPSLTEQREATQLKENMALIAKDPKGAAEYVKTMCEQLKISTEVAVTKFHSANPDVGIDAGAVRILVGVTQMLEAAVVNDPGAGVPELDVALAELLGF